MRFPRASRRKSHPASFEMRLLTPRRITVYPRLVLIVIGIVMVLNIAGATGFNEQLSLQRSLVAGQEPFAIILGCSDSRVPAELVFDQSFGDLFVIRVAGNIVAPHR